MDCSYYNGSRVMYDKVYNDYQPFHGFLSTILCSFGVLMNMCIILVLTRPVMYSTINIILTAIAVCDTTTMSTYFIYLINFHLFEPTCALSRFSYAWAVFTVFHANLSIVMRATSLWLSVVMAALRSHILSRHEILLMQSKYAVNTKLAFKLIFSTMAAVVFMSFPIFVNHTVEPIRNTYTGYWNRTDCPRIIYQVVYPFYAKQNNCLVMKLGFWTNGLLLKLIPCSLLALYLFKLIYFVHRYRRLNLALFGQQEQRAMLKPTTFLLSAILLMTFICELPNAAVSLLSSVESFSYGLLIYKSLGDIFDLLALINCITSFVLYCTMSKLFRDTFCSTVVGALKRATRKLRRRQGTSLFSSCFETQESDYDLQLVTGALRRSSSGDCLDELDYRVAVDM